MPRRDAAWRYGVPIQRRASARMASGVIDETAAVVPVAGPGVAQDAVIAGNVRESPKVGGIRESVAAGGEALVAAGRDREGGSDEECFGRRSPKFEERDVAAQRVALDLDGAAEIGAAGPSQRTGREPPRGVRPEAGGLDMHRAVRRRDDRGRGEARKCDAASAVSEIGVALLGIEAAVDLVQAVGRRAQLGQK